MPCAHLSLQLTTKSSHERVLHTLADCDVRGAKDPASACARRAVRAASLVQARSSFAPAPCLLQLLTTVYARSQAHLCHLRRHGREIPPHRACLDRGRDMYHLARLCEQSCRFCAHIFLIESGSRSFPRTMFSRRLSDSFPLRRVSASKLSKLGRCRNCCTATEAGRYLKVQALEIVGQFMYLKR